MYGKISTNRTFYKCRKFYRQYHAYIKHSDICRILVIKKQDTFLIALAQMLIRSAWIILVDPAVTQPVKLAWIFFDYWLWASSSFYFLFLWWPLNLYTWHVSVLNPAHGKPTLDGPQPRKREHCDWIIWTIQLKGKIQPIFHKRQISTNFPLNAFCWS